MARTLIKAPERVAPGAVFEVRTLIAHPMETGYRPAPDGTLVPRDLIRRFSCTLDGEAVFAAELHAAIAANPYLGFHVRAAATGPMTLLLRWQGDHDFDQTERVVVQVG